MKNYPNEFRDKGMIQQVKVTFQKLEYKGHIIYKISGNCFGRRVMDTDIGTFDNDNIKSLVENTASLKYDEEYNDYSMTLTDPNGNTLELEELDNDDIDDMIVATEIVGFEVVSDEEDESE